MESSADIPPDWSRRIRQLRSTLGLTAVDPLLLVLEGGRRLTLCRRGGGAAVFLRPGEPVSIAHCPVESLPLLKTGRGVPSGGWPIVRQGRDAREGVRPHAMGQI